MLVTHDPRLAERCASRIVTLVDGAVAMDKTVGKAGDLLEVVR